jgi:uridine kinase
VTILIGGGSCSGKTTLARALADQLQIPLISLDQFFRRHDPNGPQILINGEWMFDCNHPETIDLVAALDHLCTIPEPRIIEGHFALTYPNLRALATHLIFVDCPPQVRQARRIQRDSPAKGTPKQVLAYYQGCAVPGYEKYIEPSRIHATQVIDGAMATDRMLAQIKL